MLLVTEFKKFVQIIWHKARSQLDSQACQTFFFLTLLCAHLAVCLDIVFPYKEAGMCFSLYFCFLCFPHIDLTDFFYGC